MGNQQPSSKQEKVRRSFAGMRLGASASKWEPPKFTFVNMANDMTLTCMKYTRKTICKNSSLLLQRNNKVKLSVYAYVIFNNAKLSPDFDWSIATDGTHPFSMKAQQDYCDKEKRLFSIVIPGDAE